jgi:hypothetical protein
MAQKIKPLSLHPQKKSSLYIFGKKQMINLINPFFHFILLIIFSDTFYYCISGLDQFKSWFTPPKRQHYKLLLIFLIFSVGLLFADIITDCIAADEFFQRGDTYWGSFTLIPVFAPLLVRVIMLGVSFFRCLQFRSKKEKLNKLKLALWIQEAQQLPWHIPLLQPIRFAKYLETQPNLT